MKSFKVKAKKQPARMTETMLHEKHIGEEPTWDPVATAKLTDDEYEKCLRECWRYYNYFFNSKDMKKYVSDWVKKNMKLTPEQMAKYNASNPDLTPMTICGMAKAVHKGLVLREKYVTYIKDKVMEIIDQTAAPTSNLVAQKPKVEVRKKPTIQDRIAEKTAGIIGELEGQLDEVMMGKKNTFSVFDYLTKENFAQAQVNRVKDFFKKTVEELELAQSGKDKQMAEGYSHLTKTDFKRINEFFNKMFADLESYAQVKKAKRVARAPKAVSKEKLVSKMKYMKEFKDLKLVSINPASIIGAKEVWVYDVRVRKLYRYVADAHAGTMSVKGTSIVGFDEAASKGKTLRKPDEQLRDFFKATKAQTKKFFDAIKTVDIKPCGRMNANLMILRVE